MYRAESPGEKQNRLGRFPFPRKKLRILDGKNLLSYHVCDPHSSPSFLLPSSLRPFPLMKSFIWAMVSMVLLNGLAKLREFIDKGKRLSAAPSCEFDLLRVHLPNVVPTNPRRIYKHKREIGYG